MSPAEVSTPHARLLKCALAVEDSRAYWRHAGQERTPERAFEGYWFGTKSLASIKVLFANFRVRFDAYPEALAVLASWPDMTPATRAVLCHWHLMLADPTYRAFAGTFLPERHEALRPEVTRTVVLRWVDDHAPTHWTSPSRIQLASKLLSAAFSAGLLANNRDPRRLTYPRVEDAAIEYLLYLLRGVDIEGNTLDSPYLASVGLVGEALEERLVRLPGVQYARQADIVDLTYRYDDLTAWADAAFAQESA